MKYREVSNLCKCGKARRPGQRDCADCHRMAQRKCRTKQADPVNMLERASKRLAAKKLDPKKIGIEYQQRLEALVERVKSQIDAFNQAARGMR